MTSRIIVNNIQSDTGVTTVTIASPVALSGGITGAGFAVGTGASISSPATNVLTVSTNNVERIRVGAAGSIGIGTDNPTQKLHIQDGSDNIRINGTAIEQNTTSGLTLNGSNASGFIAFRTAGDERLRIDSSGRVTMPYQPVFYAYRSDAANTTSTGIFNSTQWNTTLVNTGSHFSTSNGRFTAPVAGVYMFQIRALVRHVSSAGAVEISLYKNGSNVVSRSFGYTYVTGSGDHDSITALGYVSLAVGDYVQMGIHDLTAGTDVFYGQNLASFCGQLVG